MNKEKEKELANMTYELTTALLEADETTYQETKKRMLELNTIAEVKAIFNDMFAFIEKERHNEGKCEEQSNYNN